MATRQHFYAEDQSETSVAGSVVAASPATKTTLTFTPDASSTYYLLWHAAARFSNTSSRVATQLWDGAAEAGYADANGAAASTSTEVPRSGVALLTSGASPSSLSYSLRWYDAVAGRSGDTLWLKQASILALKKGANDVDNGTSGDGSFTPPTGSYGDVTGGSIVLPAGTWNVFASVEITHSSSTATGQCRLVDGAAATVYGEYVDTMGTAGAQRAHYICLQVTLSGTTTLKWQAQTSATTCVVKRARIIALANADLPASYYNEVTARATTASTTYSTRASISTINPPAANLDHYTTWSASVDDSSNSTANQTGAQSTDGGTVWSGPFVQGVTTVATYRIFVGGGALFSTWPTGARTDTVDWAVGVGAATIGIQNARVLVLQLDSSGTPAGGTASETALATDVASHAPQSRSRAAANTAAASDVASDRNVQVRTATDVALASDVATRIAPWLRSTADTALASNATTRASQALIRVVADAALAADVVTSVFVPGNVSLFRTVADAAVASDIVTKVSRDARTAADVALAADAATRATQSISRTAVDVSAASDTAARLVSVARTAADAVLATDIARTASRLSRTSNDAALATDVASRIAIFVRTSSDVAIAADTCSRVLPHIRTAADVALAADLSVRQLILLRSSADAAIATDVASRTTVRARTAANTGAASDIVTRVWSATRTSTTAVSAFDVATRGAAIARVVAETSLASNAAIRTLRLARGGSDAATALASDAVTRTVDVVRQAIDVVTGTDLATRLAVFLRQAIDTAVAADLVSTGSSHTVIEQALAADSASGGVALARAAVDAASAVDSAARAAQHILRSSADHALAADAVTRQTLTPARSSAEQVSADDQTLRLLLMARQSLEAALLTDLATSARPQSRFCLDTAVAHDVAIRTIVHLEHPGRISVGTRLESILVPSDRPEGDLVSSSARQSTLVPDNKSSGMITAHTTSAAVETA